MAAGGQRLKFEWDEAKAHRNSTKHGVSFDEAATVFEDQLAVSVSDPDHSDAEQRYIVIGLSASGEMLVVVYTERGNTIRIISSRNATKKERKLYEEEPL